MFLIAGLGNPKREYDNTRHNIGFAMIDAMAEKYNISVRNIKNRAMTGQGIINGRKVLLAKPLTFMNLSGESIRPLADYYKIAPDAELIVVSDDINLPIGQIRIRKREAPEGTTGLKISLRSSGARNFREYGLA